MKIFNHQKDDTNTSPLPFTATCPLQPEPTLPLSEIGKEALDHSVGLTTLVVPLLGSLAHLGRAVHLVIVSLATTLLGILFLKIVDLRNETLVTIKMHNSFLNQKSSATKLPYQVEKQV